MKAWLARDKSGELWMYFEFPPYKIGEDGMWYADSDNYIKLDHNLYPSVKWEDEEPTEVEIIIKLKKQ